MEMQLRCLSEVSPQCTVGQQQQLRLGMQLGQVTVRVDLPIAN